VEIARAGIGHFREMLASGQYDAIYDEADATLRKDIDREGNRRALSTIQEKLRNCSIERVMGTTMAARTTGTFVRLQYLHECPSGQITETFQWRIVGGKAHLVSYQINRQVEP
jgi:hypothetical protein